MTLQNWVDFHQDVSAGKAELERFRALVGELKGKLTGIRVHGPASAGSHYGEIARYAQVPVRFLGQEAQSGIKVAEIEILPPEKPAEDFVTRFNRANARANVRVLVRVSEIERDEAGNVRKALVEHLDGTTQGTRWVRWEAGKRLCFNGFRVELRDTKRAGLHFRIGVVIEDSERDEFGYRTQEPRFISTVRIEGEGVIAMRPHDPIEPAVMFPRGSLPADAEERATLLEAVTMWYGAPMGDVGLYASGRGRSYEGPAIEYGGMKRAA